jgi:hypothetical protein
MKNISKNIGVEGRFRAQVIESDGDISFDSGEVKNLITDVALSKDRFPSGTQYTRYLCIGSGVVTTPSYSDTSLGNQVGGVSIYFYPNLAVGSVEADGFSCSNSGVATFDNLDHEISELGLREGGVTGPLLTRSLLKDADGNSTTVSVGPGQTLKITYTVYWFIPFVLAEGITPSPHGNIEWVLAQKYIDAKTQASASRVAQDMGSPWGWAGSYKILGWNASQSYSVDAVNRKSTITASIAATTDDRTKLTGDFILSGGSYAQYGLQLKAPYTLPANYDLAIEAEISWGRMP